MAPPVQITLAKLPPVAKLGIGVGLVVALLFGYWFVFYSDVASKIEGAERQKKSLRDDLVQAQQAQATYFADRGELALREQRARDLNKVLPPDAQEDAFLSSVQQASNAAGIDLKGYTPLEEVSQAFYAKVPMRIDMSGKFHQIAKFAYELGKVERIINVENIELSDAKSSGDEIVLRARCLATAFHALAPKDGRGAPKAAGARNEVACFDRARAGPRGRAPVRAGVQHPDHHGAPATGDPNGPFGLGHREQPAPRAQRPGVYGERLRRERSQPRPLRSFLVQNQTAVKQTQNQRKIELAQYSIDELKLVAIVLGGDQSRAMFVDPSGKGTVVYKGTFVCRPEVVHLGGSNGPEYQLNWRVDRIRDGDVVLIREDPAQPAIPPATRVVPLHPDTDKQAEALIPG